MAELRIYDFSVAGDENGGSLQIYDFSVSGTVATPSGSSVLQVIDFAVLGTSKTSDDAPLRMWNGALFIPVDLYFWDGTTAIPLNDLVYPRQFPGSTNSGFGLSPFGTTGFGG